MNITVIGGTGLIGTRLVVDPLARYFGTDLEERELLPGPDATIATTRFDDWIAAGGRPADRVGIEGRS